MLLDPSRAPSDSSSSFLAPLLSVGCRHSSPAVLGLSFSSLCFQVLPVHEISSLNRSKLYFHGFPDISTRCPYQVPNFQSLRNLKISMSLLTLVWSTSLTLLAYLQSHYHSSESLLSRLWQLSPTGVSPAHSLAQPRLILSVSNQIRLLFLIK